ncbi:hypothetical protein HMPREF1246_0507 [Acidaminococcus sp. BV3L6]|nr:hypothetical protein HMPREF1246_0507 [Acidaminococcus sp. BV3L6]
MKAENFMKKVARKRQLPSSKDMRERLPIAEYSDTIATL